MAQPGSVPLDAPRIHDKDSIKMAESAEAQVQWSDLARVSILRWEDDGGACNGVREVGGGVAGERQERPAQQRRHESIGWIKR